MSWDPEDVRRRAIEARRAADYAAGVADILEWLVSGKPGGSPDTASTEAAQPKDAVTASEPQRIVLDMLRDTKALLTVSEIVQSARIVGHDLMREPVRDALRRAERRGLVERVGSRYRLAPWPKPAGEGGDHDCDP